MRDDLSLGAKRLSQSSPDAVIDEYVCLPGSCSQLFVRRSELSGKLGFVDAASEIAISFRINPLILFLIQFFVKLFDCLFDCNFRLTFSLVRAGRTANQNHDDEYSNLGSQQHESHFKFRIGQS